MDGMGERRPEGLVEKRREAEVLSRYWNTCRGETRTRLYYGP